MRRVCVLLSALLILGTLGACGSAGTGSACPNLGADTKGISDYVKKRQEHGSLSSSERQVLTDLQAEARQAIAACKREGRLTTTIRNRPPPP